MRGAVGLLAALLLAGCSHPVEISNEVDPTAKATVLALGDEMARVQGEVLRLELPTSYKKSNEDGTNTTTCLLDCSDGLPQSGLTVRLDTRCGPVEYCVLALERKESEEGPWRGVLRGRKRADFQSCTAEGYRLWIDNRGRPALKLGVGPATHEVPAGDARHIDVPTPACAGMGQVTLDGVVAGELPVVPDGLDWQGYMAAAREFLIDPSGSRCYRRTTFSYSPGGSYGADPEGEGLERGRMHALGRAVDDFLRPAPESIQSPGGVGSRTQLVEVDCEPAPAPVP